MTLILFLVHHCGIKRKGSKTMKRINLKVILLTVVLCLSLSLLVSADNNKNQLMGSFQVQKSQAVKINSKDYVPLEEVARILDYNYNWELVKTKVKGHLNHRNFDSESFMIAYGYLYLPLDFFEELFDIEIIIKGNKYYVYRYRPYIPVISNLKLVLQTDRTHYRRNELIAVSLLLLNQSDRSYTLRFNSSKKFDLILKRYNREIWRLSDNMGYLQSLSFETLRPGEFRLFTNLIEPGNDRYLSSTYYTLEAEITTTNGMIISDEVDIEIY